MNKDVKIGIAIGVLVIALIAIFWWARRSGTPEPAPSTPAAGETALPPPVEPVAPVGAGPATTPAATPATPTAVPQPTLGPDTPTPVAGPTAPAPTQLAERSHTVAAGDTLEKLAQQYYGDRAKWQLILDANKDRISDVRNLKIGTKLVIPEAAGASPAPAGPGVTPAAGQRKHTVAAGETLSSIAKKYYGTEAKANFLYQANRAIIGPDKNRLKPGMVLSIPAE